MLLSSFTAASDDLLHTAARRAEKPFDKRRKGNGSDPGRQHCHDDSRKFIQKLKEGFTGDLDFPLLEDRNHQVIDLYGILNPTGKRWPHPATYVIDQAGIVRWKLIETDYKKRPSNEQILAALREIR